MTGSRFYSLFLSGEIIVSAVFLEAFGISVILLIVPFFVRLKETRKICLTHVLYFIAVGAGFMFVELFYKRIRFSFRRSGDQFNRRPNCTSRILRTRRLLVPANLCQKLSKRYGLAGRGPYIYSFHPPSHGDQHPVPWKIFEIYLVTDPSHAAWNFNGIPLSSRYSASSRTSRPSGIRLDNQRMCLGLGRHRICTDRTGFGNLCDHDLCNCCLFSGI